MAGERADRLDAVVVGGGISGLATAFHLIRAGLRVAVLEASSRVGGALETRAEGEWRFEMGPNAVVESHESVGRLIRACGLEAEKITASPTAKRRYILKGGRLIPLPGDPIGFLKTPLFPASAKLRLLKEPWIGRPSGDAEESVASFVRRRLGGAFLDNAVAPFVSGVYAGDPERLSLRWAFPRLHALEQEHGSLIRGAFARKGQGLRGAMISFRDGLEALPRQLAREIGDVRTGVSCESVIRVGDGFQIGTSVGSVEARRVVIAVPADVAARLLGEPLFTEIRYAPVALVSLGWRRNAVGHPLGGFGFLVPRREGLRLLGCLFPSEIFPGRAPEGHVALAAFVGGTTDPEIVGWDDGAMIETVVSELRGPLGLQGEPEFRLVRRWPRAIPQYEIGHGRFVERAREIERALPGLRLGGNFLGGISVPDCIRNAEALAEEIVRGVA